MPVIVAVLGAVAAFDMTIVVPVAEAIVVPVGMLLPVMTWPTTTELRLDTEVIAVLPDVRIPVTVAELGAVAAFDSTMVEPLCASSCVYDAVLPPELQLPVSMLEDGDGPDPTETVGVDDTPEGDGVDVAADAVAVCVTVIWFVVFALT